MTEHMYPYCKTQEELDNMIPPTPGTGGIGENLVYSLMKKYLPEDWHVVWHRHVDDGYKHEIDFLVFVPGKGVVNVDAKGHGWGVECNQIYCKHGTEKSYKNGHDDPFMQAEQAVATINNTFHAFLGQNWGAYACLVVFIDEFLYAGYENQYIDNIKARLEANPKALTEKINSVLDAPNPSKYHHYFTKEVMSFLLNKIIHTSEARPIEDTDFFAYDQESEGGLSLKQKRVSIVLKNNANVHVIGAAGTGKTIVAMMLAKEYVKTGKKVLYVCYNKALQQKVQRDFQKGLVQGVCVTTFHAIPNMRLPNGARMLDYCGWQSYATKSGVVSFDAISDVKVGGKPDFETLVPNFIRKGLNLFSERSAGVYDLLLVDEAQDLDNESILALFNLLKDDRKIVVFSDQGQTLFNAGWELNPDIFGEETAKEVVLDENWRNTSLIHDEFKKYAEVEDVVAMLQNGKRKVTRISNVEAKLKELVASGRQPKDIAILSTRIDAIAGLNKIHNPLKNKPESISENLELWWENKCILKRTVQGFKGLESPIVIFIPSDADDDTTLYVGESRAKYELYIVDKADVG